MSMKKKVENKGGVKKRASSDAAVRGRKDRSDRRPPSPTLSKEMSFVHGRGNGAAGITAGDLSYENLRAVLEGSPDIMAVFRDSEILFVNNLFYEILGYEPEKTGKTPPLRLVHPDDRLAAHEYCLNIKTGDDPSGGLSFRLFSEKGEETWFYMRASVVIWNGEPAVLGILRDMTRRNILESRIVQAQKLEALGILSRGIAHDFNNMLMTIQGHASLALQEEGLSEALKDRLGKIQEIVQKGVSLTSQLLGLSGTASYHETAVDINEVAEASARMIEHFNREITLHRRLDRDLSLISGDRGQIEQVLMNILVNACQSMPGGGDLFLETANLEIPKGGEDGLYRGIAPGRYVRISVTDTGIGMDESLMERIFDPFFSTRNGDMGTGLGLSAAYGIVRTHGGTIEVRSSPGQGSRFDVYLPSFQPSSMDEKRFPQEVDEGEGNATILIVDDEETVLEVNRELLQSFGYRVLEARSGREALAVYGDPGNAVDLVVLDLIMPGMSGAETYRALKEINPYVKVILLSGYSIEGGAAELLKQGCRAFVQKPFDPENLKRKIREVLEEP